MFRKPYSDELFDLLRSRFGLNKLGHLLDVGCGTGQLTLPLSHDFESAIGLDVSDEMVAEAHVAAIDEEADTVRFEVRSAEEISESDGPVRLALFGSSLHWMDIPSVLTHVHGITESGGGIAVIGMRSIWGGDAEWEITVMDVVRRFLGDERRAGAGSYADPGIKFEDAIAGAGYSNVESGEIACDYEVDIPWITGHLYSTSYSNRDLLGDLIESFEDDLESALLRLDASGRFRWQPHVSYIFADA
ncbi:MAG: class I SAM-dependent methyltransferase [Chloroflexi bacterium]|nr:class I SAM-dependent methyltransferase [Chloroflexota bacterium]